MRRSVYSSDENTVFGIATAVAGSDQSVESVSAITNLDGTGSSTTGGSITTYLWEIISGSGLVIDSPNSSTSSVSGTSVVGTTVIQLTVTDTNGNVDKDTLSIDIVVGDPLDISSTEPDGSYQGTITFTNGQPNEVIDLSFSLSSSNNPDSVTFASDSILFGTLSYQYPTGTGQITLDVNGDGSSTYTATGDYFGCYVTIVGRSSTYPIPSGASTSFFVYA